MGIRRIAALILFLAAVSAAQGQGASPKDAVRGEGFIVYSKNRTAARSLVRQAEPIQRGFTRLTGIDPQESNPIVVRETDSKTTGGAAAAARVFETDGGGSKVQVDIVPGGIRGGGWETEIARAVILRPMLESNPPRAGKPFAQPPEWFVEGLVEYCRDKEGSLPPGVDAAILQTARPPDLQRLLGEKPERMDATTLLLYRIQSAALLRTLSKRDGGKTKLGALVASPDFSTKGLDAIYGAFPDLKDDKGLLPRLWTLEIARASMPAKISSLTVQATDAALQKTLGETDSASISESLPARARDQGGTHAMRQIEIELLGLEFRGHPLLRPVVAEYRQVASLLARKPKAKVAKRLEEAAKIRQLIVERERNTRDYLNWFEATQVDTSTDPLLEQTREVPIPKKDDPLTRFLDDFERRGW